MQAQAGLGDNKVDISWIQFSMTLHLEIFNWIFPSPIGACISSVSTHYNNKDKENTKKRMNVSLKSNKYFEIKNKY